MNRLTNLAAELSRDAERLDRKSRLRAEHGKEQASKLLAAFAAGFHVAAKKAEAEAAGMEFDRLGVDALSENDPE